MLALCILADGVLLVSFVLFVGWYGSHVLRVALCLRVGCVCLRSA